MSSQKVLVTGSSGFIGMHLCKALLDEGNKVIGIDNMNSYYSRKLKEDRLEILKSYNEFDFKEGDIANHSFVDSVFADFKPKKVVNLAAQAGVRYSLENPHAYINSNIVGFMNVLEACRGHAVKGLIYASSSSVYGGNKKIPFSEKDNVDDPISIYAASKKANELMANTYSHLYGLHTTGLRFFTVYGPWGRPDMAMFIFANKMINNLSIDVYNYGDMKRDFTYIDDIISGVVSSIEKNYRCEIFNIGNSRSENLMDMIEMMEEYLGIKAQTNLIQIQPGDVQKTYADIEYSKKLLGYAPKTPISQGIPKFIDWFKEYHKWL